MTRAPDAHEISVVIPTYNDGARLQQALAGIVGQTVAPKEVIVADDASDDDTEQIVQRFAAQSDTGVAVRYVRLDKRSGGVPARNEGIRAAHGSWIAGCDSDDVWLPMKLERQLAFLRQWTEERPIALLGTHGFNVNDKLEVVSPARIGPTSIARYERARTEGQRFFLLHSSTMYARADWEAVGEYSTEYGAAHEGDFNAKMAKRGVVVCVPEPLVYYRKREASMQLDRFWDKYEQGLRLGENQRRLIRDQPPLSQEQFAAQMASAPLRSRLRRRRHAYGEYFYRVGAANMANHNRIRGARALILAAVLDRARVRSGVSRARDASGAE